MDPVVISQAEYGSRLAAVRHRMDLQGLSALIVTDPANIYYLTGYNAWSFYVPQMLFVPAEGGMVLFTREMDAHGAHRTTWLPAENIVGYPERYVQRPHLHPFDWVSFALRQRWLVAPASKGVVGMEMDSHYTSPKGFRALDHGIPEWKIVDCFELVNWVRLIKSDAEIQLMRSAARVTTKAMEAAIDAVAVGVQQNVVAAQIMQAQALGDGDAWGDYPSIVPMLPTAESADTPTSPGVGGSSPTGTPSSSSSPEPTSGTTCRWPARSCSAAPRTSCSAWRRPSRPDSTRCCRRRRRGCPWRLWRTPGTGSSPSTASRSPAAWATRSASAIHPTGASAP
ncbi:hypothetical protein GCM10025883_24060 [Mobilicoccus caccae]|uniref:Creatinase N-terminal domain-containing protein n=1 Tax=Mobilicoccus caccae TaxID=1859295 RepID=A0ABQ6IRN5_9MICO|nr:hypothetical protein GCM10025883_24060 [Mobilicoccus caccae]